MDILEFYGLNEDPFRLTPDPMFFFPSSSHNEALLSMNYVIEQREGFCLVTGEPGTGKTTLVNVFNNFWRDKAETALILTPRLSPEEFLLAVLDDLNIKPALTNKNEILKAFRDFLLEKSLKGKPVVIIVDEAQNLPDETLEELRLLSNLETDKDKLLQIILIGQPELGTRLNKDNLRQLNQRITVRIRLNPLSGDETLEYINYRLVKAGKGFLKLDGRLVRPIYKFSKGIPRIINILSSRTIMSAYLEGSNIITRKHLKYAMRHLKNGITGNGKDRPGLIYALSAVSLIVIAAAVLYYYADSLRNLAALWGGHNIEQKAGTGNDSGNIDADPVRNNASNGAERPKETAQEAATISSSHSQELSQDIGVTGKDLSPVAPVDKEIKAAQEHKKHRETGTIIVNSATIRAKPSIASEGIAWASKGIVFEITEKFTEGTGKKWYKVKISDGREGWIADKVVTMNAKN